MKMEENIMDEKQGVVVVVNSTSTWKNEVVWI